MPPSAFPAWMIEEAEGKPHARLRMLQQTDLPDNDVLVEVAYSSLNYKDGLAISGKAPIARTLALIAGIDLAGTVVESRASGWAVGDRVIDRKELARMTTLARMSTLAELAPRILAGDLRGRIVIDVTA